LTTSRPPAKLDNPSFVHWCYINILGRMPDAPGMQDWMTNLEKGASRDEIENFFRNLVISGNRFEELRWQSSLRLRDIQDSSVALENSQLNDFAPGILL